MDWKKLDRRLLALVTAYVGVGPTQAAAMRAGGERVPRLFKVRAQIDSGANCSIVVPAVVRAMGLQPLPRRPLKAHHVGKAVQAAAEYEVDISITTTVNGAPLATIRGVEVAELSLDQDDIHAVIGMDLLSQFLTIIDGPKGHFGLEFCGAAASAPPQVATHALRMVVRDEDGTEREIVGTGEVCLEP